jgi:hypothetical protein
MQFLPVYRRWLQIGEDGSSMNWIVLFFLVFGLMVLWLVVKAMKAGPRQVSDTDLDRARPLVRITTDAPGDGWQNLGSRTQADGISLRFDHDDDPQAEATLLVPERERGGPSSFGHVLTVRLTNTFETHHVHASGFVFRVRLRGDATVAGKEVRIQMKVSGGKRPYGGQIENDDDTDAAVGGWIEFEWAEVLELYGRGR